MGVGWLAIRSLRRNLGRFGLTLAGISVGVSLFVAVWVTNASAHGALDDLSSPAERERLTLEGVLAPGVPAAVVERAATLPGVAHVRAWDQLHSAARSAPDGDEPPGIVLGASQLFDGPQAGRGREAPRRSGEPSWTLDGREPRTGRDEVAVTMNHAARRLGLQRGDQFEVEAPNGAASLRIVGMWVPDRPLPDIHEHSVHAATSVETLRRLAAKEGTFGGATIQLAAGTDVGAWLTDHGDQFGDGVRVERFGYWNEALADLVDTLGGASLGIGLAGLFVGGYLVHLTLSMSVAERTRLYGTLRAMGASRGQVRRLVFGEAAGMAAIGTVAGIGLGVGAGALMNRYVATVFDVGAARLVIPGTALAGALVLGVLVTLVGAAVPGRRATALSPVAAIRGEVGTARRSRTWIVGAGFVLVAAVLAVARPQQGAVDLSAMLLLGGCVLVVAGVAGRAARPVGWLTQRLSPGIGRVAVQHLAKDAGRAGATLALVMAVLAMVFAAAITHHSWRVGLDETIDHVFPADLGVFGARDGEGAVEQIRAVEGVAAATPVQQARAEVVGRGATSVMVTAIEPASYFEVQGMPWVDGDATSARAALLDGGAVLLPEGLARRFGVARGDTLTVATGSGRHQLVVAALYASVESTRRVIVTQADARSWFLATRVGWFEGMGDQDAPTFVAVRVARGADVDAVAQALRTLPGAGLHVSDTSGPKAEARASVDRFFALLYALLLAMVLVGLLGLANTLAVSVLRRTREIGVLRAVGTRRRQVAALVLVESTTLSVIAFLIAAPVGFALASIVLGGNQSAGLDVVVDLAVPWPGVATLALVATVVAGLAAVAPARRAARVDPITALRFE